MADKEVVETSEAQIAVHWQEEDLIYPSVDFIAQANMTDEGIYDRFSLDNFPYYWKEYADLLDWFKYWDEILDASDAPCYKWFKGGKTNVAYNCIDRHLTTWRRNKAAIIWQGEPDEDVKVYTFFCSFSSPGSCIGIVSTSTGKHQIHRNHGKLHACASLQKQLSKKRPNKLPWNMWLKNF